MDVKEEMSEKEDDSGEELIHESETALIVNENKINHEDMDYHLYHNSTPDDQSEFDLKTMVEERDLKDFYHDIPLCDRDCETCVNYIKMFSEHVRTTHSPYQPIQDPLLIDDIPVPLTAHSSSSILIKSEIDEHIVKMELDYSDAENKSGDEFNHESETTIIVDKIEIKHEEFELDFNLHHNSTAVVHSGGHSHFSIQQLSSVAHFECGSTKAEEKDLNKFYNDLLLCERDCETCVKYMRMLSEHVRTTHVPHQPNQDPLLIDTVPVPLTDQSSSSLQIKSEVDEDSLKLDCSNSEEVSVPNSDADPNYNTESDSESEQIDPDYSPALSSTQNLRREGQGLARNHAPSQSRISKSKNDILPSREQFKCTECPKSYKLMCRLKEHMRIHTGEKPFKCNVCLKSFAMSSRLTTHMRVHTGEKPFKCNMCLKSFSECSALSKHKRIHSQDRPYKCNVCEMSFKGAPNLKEHTRIHTGDKLFKCDLCEKSFTLLCRLTEHKKRHTGDKPFKCDVCEKSFTRMRYLTEHKRSHTGGKPLKWDL